MKRMKPREGEELQMAILRRMTGEERVRLGAELYEMVRQLIGDGIRDRAPHLSEAEVKERVKEIVAPWCKNKP